MEFTGPDRQRGQPGLITSFSVCWNTSQSTECSEASQKFGTFGEFHFQCSISARAHRAGPRALTLRDLFVLASATQTVYVGSTRVFSKQRSNSARTAALSTAFIMTRSSDSVPCVHRCLRREGGTSSGSSCFGKVIFAAEARRADRWTGGKKGTRGIPGAGDGSEKRSRPGG